MSAYSIMITTPNYSVTIHIPVGHKDLTFGGFTGVPDTAEMKDCLKKLEDILSQSGEIGYDEKNKILTLETTYAGSSIKLEQFIWTEPRLGGKFSISLPPGVALPSAGQYNSTLSE